VGSLISSDGRPTVYFAGTGSGTVYKQYNRANGAWDSDWSVLPAGQNFQGGVLSCDRVTQVSILEPDGIMITEHDPSDGSAVRVNLDKLPDGTHLSPDLRRVHVMSAGCRLAVFALGVDGTLWLCRQTHDRSIWSNWQQTVRLPVDSWPTLYYPVLLSDNRWAVVSRGTWEEICFSRETENGTWTESESLGGVRPH
jgi:hypothetical protein